MKIKWIEFENLQTGLKIERVNFYEDITLLVGLSGVGKTQILNAIAYSLEVAINKNIRLEPFFVTICFEIQNKLYEWSYKIEESEEEVIESKEKKYAFSYEKLSEEGKVLLYRNMEKISIYGYDKVPTPRKDESLLLQYSQDKSVMTVIAELSKLYPIEIDMDVRGAIDRESFHMFKGKVKETILKAKNNGSFEIFSHLPVPLKIYVAKKYYPEIYSKIFSAIRELFMEINDIDIIEDPYRELTMVSIEVYGRTLMQPEISNGMLKTIYYIVELITMSANSLVLIDEFENGLGANCIDLLAELLLNERTDLQFIITSHHPKIINQISDSKWRIIERDINVVKNSDSESYGISHSQHDAYFNLINRWEYEGEI